MITGALGSVNVGTSLVAQQQPAVVGAGVDAADRRAALAVTPAVGEGEGALERTRDRLGVLPEHRVEEGVAGYHAAERRQHLLAVTVS